MTKVMIDRKGRVGEWESMEWPEQTEIKRVNTGTWTELNTHLVHRMLLYILPLSQALLWRRVPPLVDFRSYHIVELDIVRLTPDEQPILGELGAAARVPHVVFVIRAIIIGKLVLGAPGPPLRHLHDSMGFIEAFLLAPPPRRLELCPPSIDGRGYMRFIHKLACL